MLLLLKREIASTLVPEEWSQKVMEQKAAQSQTTFSSGGTGGIFSVETRLAAAITGTESNSSIGYQLTAQTILHSRKGIWII